MCCNTGDSRTGRKTQFLIYLTFGSVIISILTMDKGSDTKYIIEDEKDMIIGVISFSERVESINPTDENNIVIQRKLTESMTALNDTCLYP